MLLRPWDFPGKSTVEGRKTPEVPFPCFKGKKPEVQRREEIFSVCWPLIQIIPENCIRSGVSKVKGSALRGFPGSPVG